MKTIHELGIVVAIACIAIAVGVTLNLGEPEDELIKYPLLDERDMATSGSCGASVTWNVSNFGTILTISGTGPMDNYSESSTPNGNISSAPYMSEWRNTIMKIVIDPGVTSIGNYAFSHLPALKEVSPLPNTISQIGSGAFARILQETPYDGSEGDRKLIIPASVTVIGQSAFADCNMWTHIEVLGPITEVPNSFASNSKTLKECILPSSVTKFGYNVFYNNRSGESITIPNNVTEIGSGAFRESTFSNIVFPNSVTSIGDSALSSMPMLTSVTWPNGMKVVPASCFYRCDQLTTLNNFEQVTEIKDHAFYQCYGILHINFPNVQRIGESAFELCGNLSTINIPKIEYIEACAFEDTIRLSTIDLPNTLTYIGREAFGHTGLNEFIMPDSVTEIAYEVAYPAIIAIGTESIEESEKNKQFMIYFSKNISKFGSTNIGQQVGVGKVNLYSNSPHIWSTEYTYGSAYTDVSETKRMTSVTGLPGTTWILKSVSYVNNDKSINGAKYVLATSINYNLDDTISVLAQLPEYCMVGSTISLPALSKPTEITDSETTGRNQVAWGSEYRQTYEETHTTVTNTYTPFWTDANGTRVSGEVVVAGDNSFTVNEGLNRTVEEYPVLYFRARAIVNYQVIGGGKTAPQATVVENPKGWTTDATVMNEKVTVTIASLPDAQEGYIKPTVWVK